MAPQDRSAPRLRNSAHLLLAIAGVVAVCSSADRASAINIILNYNAGASAAPAFDPTGAQLTAIMQAVETRYQDIFEDTHTITINYWWEDLSGGLLGDHDLVSQSGGRETVANLRFDTQANTGGALRNYFFDPTPHEDEEYNMGQVLYRDLSLANQAAFFNGSPPDLLEVGYLGTARADGPANGLLDLLSLAFHETGHALGMSSSNASTIAETLDGDYDYNPAFVFGANAAIGIYTAGTDSLGHLDNNQALMFGGGIGLGSGTRRRPSASDLFAMASAHSYVEVDLARQDLLGGGIWNTPGNWEGNQVPGAADDAWVRTGGNVSLSANASVSNLVIGESSDVLTGANTLDVGETLTIQHDGSLPFPQLFVQAGGEVEAGDLIVNGGELDLSGGLADIQDDLRLEAGGGRRGAITGAGAIDVAGTFVNNGLVRPDGGTLTFVSAAASPWDLDGTTGDGELDATVGDVEFQSGGLLDDFDGQITVGSAHRITFAEGWTLNTGGQLALNGGADFANRAEIDGGPMTLRGQVTVNGYGELDGVLTLASTAAISVLGANDRLDLGSGATDIVTFNGPTIAGEGLVSQHGNLVVAVNTTMAARRYNWDGSASTTTTVNNGVTYTINSLSIEDTANDGFDGAINLNGGAVAVNTGNIVDLGGGLPIFIPAAWVLDSGGELNLNNGGEVLAGSPLDASGQIAVTGVNNSIHSGLILRSTVQVSVPTNTNLEFDGVTTYRGGAYTGNGVLRQSGPATVAENTTVNVARFDLDGLAGVSAVTTINPGVTFTIQALAIEESNNDGFDGELNVNSGALAVNTGMVITTDPPIFLPSSWRMEGELNLNNTGGGVPTLNGSPMIVDGVVNAIGGPGEINAVVVLEDGMFNVDAVSTLRQDGNFTQQGGQIAIAAGGRMQANATATFQSGASVAAAGVLELNGATSFQGGAYTGAGEIQLDGPTTIDAATTMNVARVDMDGAAGTSAITLAADWTVNATEIDDGNNVFHGTININNLSHQLTVSTAAPWTMAGALNISTSTSLTFPSVAGQDVVLAGTATIDGGTRFDARADVTGDIVLVDAGSRLAFAGGDLANPSTFAAAATANGPGALVVNPTRGLRLADGASIAVEVENRGQLEVGASPGSAKIAAFDQDALGTLLIELAGTTAGTEYDTLFVSGLAELDGALDVDLMNGFLPSLGDVFTVLYFDSVIDDFAQYRDTIIAAAFLELQPMLLADRLELRAKPAVDGDINTDGVVDIFDVAEVSNHWGESGPAGDANCDGVVDIFDVAVVSNNWGAEFTAPAAAVPEPASWALAMVAASAMALGRRHVGKAEAMS